MRLSLLMILSLILITSCGGSGSGGKGASFSNSSTSNPPKVPSDSEVEIEIEIEPENGQVSYGAVSSPYSYGGYAVNQILQSNICITGTSPDSRATFQQRVFMGSLIAAGDLYAGVTSYGDVAILLGDGSETATFIAYVCSRGSQEGASNPQLVTRPTLGSTSACRFKPIISASFVFPNSSTPLYFRMLDGMNSQGQKFPFCI